MRVALFALLLAGCSLPALNDPDPQRADARVDAARDTEEQDPGFDDASAADASAPDTYVSVDTAIATDTYVQPDTYVAPDTAIADTKPCRPLIAAEVCKTSVPLSTACATRPDGCGGTVTCAACPATRKCVSSPSDLGHCGCTGLLKLCTTPSDVGGRLWDCALDETPTHPGAVLVPQPDGSIARWCIPSI